MDLGRYIEEKWVRNAKIRHFLGKTREWYWYQKVVQVPSGTGTKKWYRYPWYRGQVVPVPLKVVPVPIDSEGLVPVPVKVVPVPLFPTPLIFGILQLLSPYSYTDCLGTLMED